MSYRSAVPPSTLSVRILEDAIEVVYHDGRRVRYENEPTTVTGSVRTRPGTIVQVLVVDTEADEGAITYVNDRDSHDDILEKTGVGRLIVEPGDTKGIFQGVTAHGDGHAVEVRLEDEVDERVFVFAEDDRGEAAYELIPDEE